MRDVRRLFRPVIWRDVPIESNEERAERLREEAEEEAALTRLRAEAAEQAARRRMLRR